MKLNILLLKLNLLSDLFEIELTFVEIVEIELTFVEIKLEKV